eukprot:6462385-Prymnesium_polylepis.1
MFSAHHVTSSVERKVLLLRCHTTGGAQISVGGFGRCQAAGGRRQAAGGGRRAAGGRQAFAKGSPRHTFVDVVERLCHRRDEHVRQEKRRYHSKQDEDRHPKFFVLQLRDAIKFGLHVYRELDEHGKNRAMQPGSKSQDNNPEQKEETGNVHADSLQNEKEWTKLLETSQQSRVLEYHEECSHCHPRAEVRLTLKLAQFAVVVT